MKTNIFIIAMIIVLAIASHYGFYELGKKNAEIKYVRDTDTIVTYRTIKDIQIIPKYTTIYKTDSVKTTDTLFVFDTSYVASLDTTYEDDLVKLKVDFISDIPLSKKSYFNLDVNVKKEIVFVPTYKAYEPDTWGVGFGILGHFQDSVKVNLFGNISYKIFNYKYFEMPITAEIELGDNLNIVDKKLRIEGRLKF